jgi:hypothetical protein
VRALRGYRISAEALARLFTKDKRHIYQVIDGPPERADYRYTYFDQQTQTFVCVFECAANKYNSDEPGFEMIPDGGVPMVKDIIVKRPNGETVP